MAVAALFLTSTAVADEGDEPEPEPGRITITLDGTSLMGGSASSGPAVSVASRVRFEAAVSRTLSLWVGPQARLIATGLFLQSESVFAPELAVGVRLFPSGRAPEGFNLGAMGSAGGGTYRYESKALFSGRSSTEEGRGATWSAGASAGYEWITKGGFSIGLRLEAATGTSSIREGSTANFGGLAYSIGGVL